MKKKKTSAGKSVKVVAPSKPAKKQDRVLVFDTTLRDGEQSPGCSMNHEEKLMVAEVLDQMGVDIIEAGFAMASNGDFEAINAIAKQKHDAVICSLARSKFADIERAAEAIKPARRNRIHVFMSTSPIHLKYQFKMSQDEVLALIKQTVTHARKFTDNVEWSAMDATRTGLDYLSKAVEVAIKAGATTINLPDTVGYATPEDITKMFTTVMNKVPNSDKAIFSFHGQNDLGLATANTLAAIRAGARQAELTINGIGERAGNTSLEEVVMTLRTRAESFGLDTRIKTEHIMRASRLIQSITGQNVQANKAIVGANAFAHESGIHQDGMLKHAGTYEIMTPESVGLTRSLLVLGKHSGRHAFRDKIKQLGFNPGDNAFEDAFNRFKELADKKKEVFDDDLIALLDEQARKDEDAPYEFISLEVRCGSKGKASAALELKVKGKKQAATITGDGPVDATLNAIKKLIPITAKLELYQVHAVTGGTDAQAEVSVRLNYDGRIINGTAADTDTLVASAMAYLNALNKIETLDAKMKPEKAALSS